MARSDPPFVPPTRYNAKQIIHVGGRTVEQQIFQDGPRFRVDTLAGQVVQAVIVDRSKQVVYTLLPSEKSYQEKPYKDSGVRGELVLEGPQYQWSWEGTEVVGGELCDRYKVRWPAGSAVYWVSQATHFPRRMIGNDGRTLVEWPEYVIGAQPPELFQLPPDYKKISPESELESPVK